ncbi:hypothetical protein NDU88_008924 [Pleurodeles waltl]|uniref:Uncharacterized protein n=1 Tax=Pleurodeles waltl TaxID=8319 RepID=A0AAV7RZ29_PLEWA|nr:hypothetical protein NDU88_008924 [Pleurodeles waltl]
MTGAARCTKQAVHRDAVPAGFAITSIDRIELSVTTGSGTFSPDPEVTNVPGAASEGKVKIVSLREPEYRSETPDDCREINNVIGLWLSTIRERFF